MVFEFISDGRGPVGQRAELLFDSFGGFVVTKARGLKDVKRGTRRATNYTRFAPSCGLPAAHHFGDAAAVSSSL